MKNHLQDAADRASTVELSPILVGLCERLDLDTEGEEADEIAVALAEAMLVGIRMGAVEAAAMAIEQGADVKLTFEEE